MTKNFMTAFLDGFVSALLIFILGKYSISSFVSFESLFEEMFFIMVCIFISAISAIYNLQYKSVCETIIGYLISLFSNIIFLCIIFSLNTLAVDLKVIEIFPARELENADGLYVILFEGVYLVAVLLVRIIIFIIQLAKVIKKNKSEKVLGIS